MTEQTDERREELRALLLQARQILDMAGYTRAYVRDQREPGRARKARRERIITRIVAAHLGRVRSKVETWLSYFPPPRKAIPLPEDVFHDPTFEAELVRALTDAGQDGVILFNDMVDTDVRLDIVNRQAARWARTAAATLVKDIDRATGNAIRDAVAAFVELPGMTVGDVMNAIAPTVGRDRAQRIAVTEITRAYATANELAGKELQRMFPGLIVVKTWNTNKDDKVCDVCGPLDGMSVGVDKGFTTEDVVDLGIPSPPAHPNCRCWIGVRTVISP